MGNIYSGKHRKAAHCEQAARCHVVRRVCHARLLALRCMRKLPRCAKAWSSACISSHTYLLRNPHLPLHWRPQPVSCCGIRCTLISQYGILSCRMRVLTCIIIRVFVDYSYCQCRIARPRAGLAHRCGGPADENLLYLRHAHSMGFQQEQQLIGSGRREGGSARAEQPQPY